MKISGKLWICAQVVDQVGELACLLPTLQIFKLGDLRHSESPELPNDVTTQLSSYSTTVPTVAADRCPPQSSYCNRRCAGRRQWPGMSCRAHIPPGRASKGSPRVYSRPAATGR